jgi:hypothetical protein
MSDEILSDAKEALFKLDEVFERWVECDRELKGRSLLEINHLSELEQSLIVLNIITPKDAPYLLNEHKTKFLHLLAACNENDNLQIAVGCARLLNEIGEKILLQEQIEREIRATEL